MKVLQNVYAILAQRQSFQIIFHTRAGGPSRDDTEVLIQPFRIHKPRCRETTPAAYRVFYVSGARVDQYPVRVVGCGNSCTGSTRVKVERVTRDRVIGTSKQ